MAIGTTKRISSDSQSLIPSWTKLGTPLIKQAYTQVHSTNMSCVAFHWFYFKATQDKPAAVCTHHVSSYVDTSWAVSQGLLVVGGNRESFGFKCMCSSSSRTKVVRIELYFHGGKRRTISVFVYEPLPYSKRLICVHHERCLITFWQRNIFCMFRWFYIKSMGNQISLHNQT